MPLDAGPRSHRNLLPSTNAALEALEAAIGQPVTIVEDPELSVAATVRRAKVSKATHILMRRRGSCSGSDRKADYLITYYCCMTFWEVEPQVKATLETAAASGQLQE